MEYKGAAKAASQRRQWAEQPHRGWRSLVAMRHVLPRTSVLYVPPAARGCDARGSQACLDSFVTLGFSSPSSPMMSHDLELAYWALSALGILVMVAVFVYFIYKSHKERVRRKADSLRAYDAAFGPDESEEPIFVPQPP
ncbi:unnamed protein product [Darwinula stevensoni]|uniref:Uncharacterized protein n=1 Tax=Darwinula stevensoni TaxID=69355 RepID=A0A7R8XBW0_9CRUS|nr:unnamed protein product [Darwinula stevensoni]CAG0892757.1 unnamed protein product [Darwinula stevensoni]